MKAASLDKKCAVMFPLTTVGTLAFVEVELWAWLTFQTFGHKFQSTAAVHI
jgi:hypothetical protein